MNNPLENKLENDNEVNIGRVFRLLLMQSKLMLLIIFVFTSLSIAFYIYSTKIFKASSLIQVYSNQSSSYRGGGQDLALDLFLGDSNVPDIRDIENLYKSRSNLLKIIADKKLNIKVDGIEYQDKSKIFKTFSSNNQNIKLQKYEIQFFDQGYTLNNLLSDEVIQAQYNENVNTSDLNVNLNRPSNLSKIDGEVFELQLRRAEDVYLATRGRLQITSFSNSGPIAQRTGLLEISYNSSDLDEAIDVLNYANNYFIKQNIKTEAEQARKAIEFIDNQISQVDKQLNSYKSDLRNFREENKSINVDLEISTIIESLTIIENQINNLELEIASANSNYTSSNPIFLKLIGQRDALISQKEEVENKIANLPLAQQEYIDLFRAVEITEEAFVQLTNKKLEFSIREASTLGNMRIIDNAYYKSIVSPSIIIILFSFFFSTFLSLLIGIIRGVYFLPISNPAEILDNGVSTQISGVLPKSEEDESEKFEGALESLIVNMQTQIGTENKESCKLISFTSPTASNGKSFVSRQVAKKLASLNNKVLLIDLDLKRGDQHKEFDCNRLSISDFNNINEENIKKLKVEENLYLIPKIKNISNTFQFVFSNSFNEKIDFFKKHFDYVIFDTAPILFVSDTSFILQFSDIVYGICRHGLTKMNEVRQMNAVLDQIGVNLDGIIYNFYEKPKSYYGYYGLYGNYNYQYYAQKYLYGDNYYDKKD